MNYREPYVCIGCGHRDARLIEVFGDYDEPDEVTKVRDCPVCRSPEYKKLKNDYEQLLRRLP